MEEMCVVLSSPAKKARLLLRPALRPVDGFDAIVGREHREADARQDLLLLRDAQSARDRRNVRRLLVAAEEREVAVEADAQSGRRLRGDGRGGDEEMVASGRR